MKDKKFLVPLCIAAIAISLGFIVWRGMQATSVEGNQTPSAVGGQTPPPRADSPDFGPIDDKFIIGKNPAFKPVGKGQR